MSASKVFNSHSCGRVQCPHPRLQRAQPTGEVLSEICAEPSQGSGVCSAVPAGTSRVVRRESNGLGPTTLAQACHGMLFSCDLANISGRSRTPEVAACIISGCAETRRCIISTIRSLRPTPTFTAIQTVGEILPYFGSFFTARLVVVTRRTMLPCMPRMDEGRKRVPRSNL
jgi:hypothetical protein